MIGGFEFAVRAVGRIGLVMEAAVGQGTAQAFVKEQEQEGDLDALGGEPIGVAAAVAFEQSVAFEFAQIVAKLVQSVGFRRRAGTW